MKSAVMPFYFFLVCCWMFVSGQPAEKTILPLWEDTLPMALGAEDKDSPTLTVYPVSGDDATECGIVVCPGGGYGHLAMEHEGYQIAEWFNGIGVSAFVLKYRLPSDGYRHPVPLMDAQRAVCLVRYNAKKWNIDPAKIGIIGFSAGGHLASSVGTHIEKPVVLQEDQNDEINAASCRPDFMVLVYPVISMQDEITHRGSKENLLGNDPEPALVELMSNEKQVTSETPPTFLVHANDDEVVLPENSIRFYQACRKQKVPVEMHIYLKGGHGFGIRPGAGPACEWPYQCRKWMQQMNFLPE